MTSTTSEPAGTIDIRPRDRRFGRGSTTPRLWHGGRVAATAIYNALSTTFPRGEAFFVESVRAFVESAPPKLAAEIRAFTTQEAIHSREHQAFNRRAADSGYALGKLDAQVEKRLAVTRTKPPIVSLAATMALEHFTAILAHELLADPRHLGGADEETAALWRWHALEEIEHKAVAYDTWLEATKNWSRWNRWKLKARVMLYVTRNFLVDRTLGALELMRQDHVTGPRAWAQLLTYLIVAPGMFRKIVLPWIRYFLAGFHPWNEDDRYLLKDNVDRWDNRKPQRRVRSAA